MRTDPTRQPPAVRYERIVGRIAISLSGIVNSPTPTRRSLRGGFGDRWMCARAEVSRVDTSL